MGALNIPPSGLIYVDTAPVIYSVEKNSECCCPKRPPQKNPGYASLPACRSTKTIRCDQCVASSSLHAGSDAYPGFFIVSGRRKAKSDMKDSYDFRPTLAEKKYCPIYATVCAKIYLCTYSASKRLTSVTSTDQSNFLQSS